MVVHAPSGHASLRHTSVTLRPRSRSILVHAAKKPDPSTQLGDAVVAFAMRAQGRQIGDGECFSLADQALSTAGARSAADYTEITPDGDYVWGRPVSLSAVRPGDILQFRNFHILRRVTTTIHTADGGSSTTQSQEMEERDHHTAIVTANYGTVLAIAEQNVAPAGRVVQRTNIDIASGVRRTGDSATDTTTETSVEGTVWAYRPQRLQSSLVASATTSGS